VVIFQTILKPVGTQHTFAGTECPWWPNRRYTVLSWRKAPWLQEPNTSNYAELIAGIREGNSSAVTNFRNAFAPRIQFFITRVSNKGDVLDRVEEAIMFVIQEIKQGHVNRPYSPLTDSQSGTPR